jgi:putative membrane protein
MSAAQTRTDTPQAQPGEAGPTGTGMSRNDTSKTGRSRTDPTNTDASQAATAPVRRSAREVARQSRNVADSAAETRHAAARIETSADLNTRLAADRNVLAAERTYAAWVRTGLFALASGIGAHALLGSVVPAWLARADGSLLIAFSIFCFGAAIWRYLEPGPPPPVPQLKPIPRGLLIGLNGFLALVSLAALIGLWLAPPLVAPHGLAP